MEKVEQVTQADREAMVYLERANAASSGIPARLIRPKIDAILAGDFDRSPEARSFVNHRIEATRANDEEIARYREALEAILNEETVSVHVGYDSGSGGGNFVYVDAVRTDSDAFDQARKALGASNA